MRGHCFTVCCVSYVLLSVAIQPSWLPNPIKVIIIIIIMIKETAKAPGCQTRRHHRHRHQSELAASTLNSRGPATTDRLVSPLLRGHPPRTSPQPASTYTHNTVVTL